MDAKDFKVGMKVRHGIWGVDDYVTITAIGKQYFLAMASDGTECRFDLNDTAFGLYEPPKKTVRLAPYLYRGGSGRWCVSDSLFSSAEDLFVGYIWPAIPNKDGFYEVPE